MSPTSEAPGWTALQGLIQRKIRTSSRLKASACMALAMLASGCQLLDMAKLSYVNANSEHEWSGRDRSSTVPFSLINNHIIVPVSINGSEPLNFVLDSGAGATVITESHRSRQLKLKEGAEVTLSGAGSGFVSTASIVEDTRVSIGAVSLLGQSVVRIPLDAIPFFSELDEVYFDGIIGYDFLRRFVVEINYDAMQVVFWDSAAYQPPADLPGRDWQALPLEIAGSMPFITTQVSNAQGDTISVKFLVDTGSTGSFSLIPSSHDAIKQPDQYYTITAQGLTGDMQSLVVETDFLALGSYRLTDLVGSYSISGEDSENGSNGNLGNRVMSRFNVIFDYPDKRMLVQPNHRFYLPITDDRSGLRILPHRRGGKVTSVAAGTAGAGIGLQAGDIITRFDDELVTELSIDKLQRTLASSQDVVHLCWVSAVAERCAPLKLSARTPSSAGRTGIDL